jgi:hypothetical protein
MVVAVGSRSMPISELLAGIVVPLSRLANLMGVCHEQEDEMGRGILLWLLGVPIPIIILLALLWH